MAKIALKVPHSTKYEGAVSKRHHERLLNKRLLEELKDILVKAGHQVLLIEINNKNLSDKGHTLEACTQANNWGADILIDSHSNSYSKESANGSECWLYSSKDTIAKRFSDRLLKNLASKGFSNRGLKYKNSFWVLQHTKMPAVITESHFITNNRDCDIMDSLSWDELARLYANALDSNIPLIVPSTPIPTPPQKQEFKVGSYGKKVAITATSLNVRSGRGTEHSVIGSLSNGNIVTINYILQDSRDGKGNNELWGSFDYSKGVTGYIHLGYVKAI